MVKERPTKVDPRSMARDRPFLHPKTVAEWRRWLREHHDSSTGVWLVLYRTRSGKARVDYAEVVEEALCYGWIDSLTKVLDESRVMQLFTPRRLGSRWSATNKLRVRQLIAAGRMRPPGLATIAAAKKNGSWTIMDAVERLVVPRDLARALASANAKRAFDALAPSARKQHLWSVVSLKRPESRARRIATIVEGLSSRTPA